MTKTLLRRVRRDMPHRFFRLGLAITFAVSATGGAQDKPLTKGDRFFNGSLGVSFYSTVGPHFALLRNRKVVTLGLKRERVFSVSQNFAIASTIEIPLSMILPAQNPKPSECWWRSTTGKQECYAISHPNYPVGAIGVTPLGIKVIYGPAQRFHLFGSVAGGAVAFDRKTPVADASALNFAAEYLLGAALDVSGRRSVEIAWKYQHWSNANTSHFNPGLDVNLITIGLKTRR
jgi:hypothetical protein